MSWKRSAIKELMKIWSCIYGFNLFFGSFYVSIHIFYSNVYLLFNLLGSESVAEREYEVRMDVFLTFSPEI